MKFSLSSLRPSSPPHKIYLWSFIAAAILAALAIQPLLAARKLAPIRSYTKTQSYIPPIPSSSLPMYGPLPLPGDSKKEEQLQRTAKIMREMKIPVPSQRDAICTNEILGFRFYHPVSWGSCKCYIESGAPNGHMAGCKFENSELDIAAISKNYDDPSGGRGLSTAEALSLKYEEIMYSNYYPETVIKRKLSENLELQIWNNWPAGWDEVEYVFAFLAPTKHLSVNIIGASGPIANSAHTTEEDIRDFLLAAYTYELLP